MTRKFVFGLPPANPDFNREAEGWRLLKEPSPVVSCWLIGLPLAIVLGFLFYEMANRWAGFSMDQLFEQSSLATLWAIWVALIVVHELLHGLIHPGLGLSPHTFFGLSLKTGAFWAHYTGPMSRERMLLLMVTPFLALSVITLLIACLVPPVAITAGFVAILNAAFSAVDLFGSSMIMAGIPAGATVQNNGWSTYWKPGCSNWRDGSEITPAQPEPARTFDERT